VTTGVRADARILGDLSEAEVILLFTDGASRPYPEVLVGNGDDAAVWQLRPKMAQVATTDGQVEGVHFTLDAPAHAIGRKLLAVNLSDLAAMGAEPRYALIAACLPRDLLVEIARDIGRGAREIAFEHRVHLIGGNVTRSPKGVVLHATLLGEVEPSKIMRRSGLYAGDRLLVSGTLGNARLGLRADVTHAVLKDALFDPVPRVGLGRALSASGLVRAACDVSDGLARDAVRLVEQDRLGAVLDLAALPLSAAAREVTAALGLDPQEIALLGGEDYELLVAVAPEDVEAAKDVARAEGETLTEIGVVSADPGLFSSNKVPLGKSGFEHFG